MVSRWERDLLAGVPTARIVSWPVRISTCFFPTKLTYSPRCEHLRAHFGGSRTSR